MTTPLSVATPPGATFPFTYSAQLTQFVDTTPAELLAQNPQLHAFAVGAFVFNHEGKLLLVKRAKDERTFPDLWEVPGGGYELTDATILDTLSRELREETGLTLTHVTDCFSQQDFAGSTSGCQFRKFNFLVAVEDTATVTLDDKEHSEYGWYGKSVVEFVGDGTAIEFTTENMRKCVEMAFEIVEKGKDGRVGA